MNIFLQKLRHVSNIFNISIRHRKVSTRRRPRLYLPPSFIARLSTRKLDKLKTKLLKPLSNNTLSQNFTEEQMMAYFTRNDTRKYYIFKLTFWIGLCNLIIADTSFLYYPYIYPYLTFIGVAFLLFSSVMLIILKLRIRIPTDEEYDAWVDYKAKANLRKALFKINQDHLKDEEIEEKPFIHGFVLEGTKNAKNYRLQDIHWKTGKDRRQRYSINVFRYFLPVEHQLAVIVIDINAVNHKDRREQIHEYFFTDVVAVTTEDEYDEIGSSDYLTKSFTLRICDGKAINATILSQPLDRDDKLTTFELPSTKNVEKTISSIRMLLRSNKIPMH